jgi:molybdate transport system substrate-binding protein
MTHPGRTSRILPGLVILASLPTLLAGCGGDDAKSGDKTTLTVFAASSLTGTFGELETAFEKDHPDVDVVISFDSSSALATEITAGGAPADVLATADESSMAIVVDAGDNAEKPIPFASNTMAVVTPPDNPAGVEGLDDLEGTDFVLCDPSAPCGAVAAKILDNAGVTAEPVSLEDKVTAVLSKVQLGEADAGIVYVTDALAAGNGVNTIDIPDDVNVVTPYYIAAVKDSANADLANEWISLVSSQAGQGVFAEAGFGGP